MDPTFLSEESPAKTTMAAVSPVAAAEVEANADPVSSNRSQRDNPSAGGHVAPEVLEFDNEDSDGEVFDDEGVFSSSSGVLCVAARSRETCAQSCALA